MTSIQGPLISPFILCCFAQTCIQNYLVLLISLVDSQSGRKRACFLKAGWEVNLTAKPRLCHPFKPALTRWRAGFSHIPLSSTSVRGDDGLLKAPIPQWVCGFKIARFSKKEQPRRRRGKRSFFFFTSYTHCISLLSVAIIESTN